MSEPLPIPGVNQSMTDYEKSFLLNAIRRKKLFLVLSVISVMTGLSLALFYAWKAYTYPQFDASIHALVVLLILLNARQNLRQYNYAKILGKLSGE